MIQTHKSQEQNPCLCTILLVHFGHNVLANVFLNHIKINIIVPSHLPFLLLHHLFHGDKLINFHVTFHRPLESRDDVKYVISEYCITRHS